MNLSWSSQSAIELAAREEGLRLSAEALRAIVQAESSCLREYERISFGEGAAAQIVREFATSPFVAEEADSRTFVELTGAFYELRDSLLTSVTDVEIIEALREAFDGEAAGNAELAAALAREPLLRRQDHATYLIVDDDDRVYRWDSDEWREDVTARGWYGERWEDTDV
ncbi:MAG: DUF6323 family protein [Coriobacteriales bacterium]|nr:DUF6323 family protein [Coriobacteriales bacterium]